MLFFECIDIKQALSSGNTPVEKLFKCWCAETGIVPELSGIAYFFNFLPADSSCARNINNFDSGLNKLESSRCRDAASDLFGNNRYRNFSGDDGKLLKKMFEISISLRLKKFLGGIQVYNQSIRFQKFKHDVDFRVSQPFCDFRRSDVGKNLYRRGVLADNGKTVPICIVFKRLPHAANTKGDAEMFSSFCKVPV